MNEDICALDLEDRRNLNPEMTALVKGIEKKYGFVPHFVQLFATDNQRLKAFMGQYMELMRRDSGLTPLEHEMIALVSAATNGCVYCTAHHGALLRAETGDALFTEYPVAQLPVRRADAAPPRDARFHGAGQPRRRGDHRRGSAASAQAVATTTSNLT